MSTTVTTSPTTDDEVRKVRETLRLVITKLTEAAQQHPLSLATTMVDVRIRGLIRLNQQVYAIDTKWKFVIHVQESILCVKRANGVYVEVDIDKLDIDLAASLTGSIGVITAMLQRQ